MQRPARALPNALPGRDLRSQLPPRSRLHLMQCHYRQVGNSGNCRSTHSPGIEVQRHVPQGSRRVEWDPGEGGVCLLGMLACWGCGWRKESSLWILNRICEIQGSPAHPTMANRAPWAWALSYQVNGLPGILLLEKNYASRLSFPHSARSD